MEGGEKILECVEHKQLHTCSDNNLIINSPIELVIAQIVSIDS